MLVSSIARFNAISQMNTASMNMRKSMGELGVSHGNIKNIVAGGEHSLELLQQMESKLSLDLASNNLLYKLAYLQEKTEAKKLEREFANNKLNLMA